MSQTITVPTTIDYNPLTITIGGVSYTLAPGATVTVPDAVAYELERMLGTKGQPPAPPADFPYVDAEVYERLAALEAFLPEYPEEDGIYTLQLVMEDGEPTLAWVEADDESSAVEK